MLAKKYRLTRSVDFHRVHAEGRCRSDRMLVLCKRPNGLVNSRFGFSVGKRVGNAVARNRIKRLLRQAVRSQCDLISPGWDVVFFARKGIIGADYGAVERSALELLSLAHLLQSVDSSAAADAE